nr:calcium homeostasis modulator protein 6-like isoform X1 [Ciona intestinalis]|eukprot:XP_026693716.1 calcium homeostasis modulator protein 6-like isoform X1 [Ciona intestinalis]
MVKLPENVNSLLLSAGKTVKTSSGSAVNIIICLFTVGSEQLFSFAVFNCPCTRNSTSATLIPGVSENAIYGGVYIIVPAIALFILGIAMNQKTWKLMTGCARRHQAAARGYKAGCATLMEILMQAMVAPCAWIAIAMLDGKYYACATTVQPFDMTCRAVTRTPANKIRYTVTYERNKRKSQTLGWIFIALALFIGSIVYMANRWFSRLTYLHRNYMLWYHDIEDQKFELIAKEQIEEEAEKNIRNFLADKRPKLNWDKISTVFDLVRDRKGYAIYSRLDEWNECHPINVEDNISDKTTNGSKDKHSSVADDAGFGSSSEMKNNSEVVTSNSLIEPREIEMNTLSTGDTHKGYSPSAQHDIVSKPLLEFDGAMREDQC